MTAKLESILTTVQTQIQALNLSGIADADIVVRSVPFNKDLTTFPHIVIAPFGNEEEQPGTNASDDIGYPVSVCVVSNPSLAETNRGTYLQWRESIRKEFINQRLSTYAHCNRWRPLSIVEQRAWSSLGLFISGQVFVFLSREQR